MLSSRNLMMLTGLGAMLAIVVLFAGVAAQSADHRTLPVAEAAPLAPATTTTTSATTTAPVVPGADSYGFVDSEARCDQAAVAIGRTQRSKVVICPEADGGYEYRGVRISDGASLVAAAKAVGGGTFEARTDGSVYAVSPENLVVTSGGKVIYRDTWLSFDAPSYAAEQGAPRTSSTPTTSASTSATARR